MTINTELYYVCRGPIDGRPLTANTADRQQAIRDLRQLQHSYPEAALATLAPSFDAE